LAGWFSLANGGATAGDIMVRDVVAAWLREARIDHDIAQEPFLGPGVDWFRIPPSNYSHLVLACGPVGQDLEVAEIVKRFACCRTIALNVSFVGDPSWQSFDRVLERDRPGFARPDLAWSAEAPTVPVVVRVQIHDQGEYEESRPDEAHQAFDRLLAARPAAAFMADTRLDPIHPGRRSAAEVESLISRSDVTLTTRLHGLVLSLRCGIPAIVVDPIPKGAKVLAQARAIGWPAVTVVDEMSDELLAGLFDWCLTPAGRAKAEECANSAAAAASEVRSLFMYEFKGA